VNIVVEDDYPARARAIESVLGPGLERLAKQFPEIISGVRGAGALWGVFIDGGPRVLDLVSKLAPSGFARDPLFRTKLVMSAVVDALYRDHDIYAYYALNGRNPMMAAPPLIAGPAEVEYFLDRFETVLGKGLPRLLTRFVRERVVSLW
jgi:putrescine aminotransferase